MQPISFEERAKIKAFMNAVSEGNTATIQVLLNEGVDANARNKNGRTALMIEGHDGHKDIVEVRRLRVMPR